MSKYVPVVVSISLSADFYLEVADDATEEDIKALAEKEVVLPHNYHRVVDQMLKRMGIVIHGLDSMLKAWNVDELEYIIDNELLSQCNNTEPGI